MKNASSAWIPAEKNAISTDNTLERSYLSLFRSCSNAFISFSRAPHVPFKVFKEKKKMLGNVFSKPSRLLLLAAASSFTFGFFSSSSDPFNAARSSHICQVVFGEDFSRRSWVDRPTIADGLFSLKVGHNHGLDSDLLCGHSKDDKKYGTTI